MMKKKDDHDNQITELEENVRPMEDESQADVQAQEALVTDLENQLRRALADYQNLQRRVVEERSEVAKYATKNLLLALLPILDHLDQAVATAPDEEKKSNWFTAVTISLGQLKDVLKREGIEEINPIGKEFDASEHEVVDVVSEGKDNHIIKVLQKGYKLYGKVISPARVVVAKAENH